MEPIILSMEVDDDNAFESEYRIRIGSQVRYLVVAPGVFDRDTLSDPLPSLPALPYKEDWTVASISRDGVTGNLQTILEKKKLLGVSCLWHQTHISCLEIDRVEQLTATAFEAKMPLSLISSKETQTPTVIAKIARFEWEVPRIERETRAYQLLESSGLAPRFLAHVHENGRFIGFLLEKVPGRRASIEDLDMCQTVLNDLHGLGILHGDVCRYNFLIAEDRATMIDFENFEENASEVDMKAELGKLSQELVDTSGRGGGWLLEENDSAQDEVTEV